MTEITNLLTNEEYHRHAAISRSMIMEFHKLPALCYYRYINPVTRADASDAMNFGTALHSAVLEPKLYEETFVVHPKYTGPGSRALNKQFEQDMLNQGKSIISEDEKSMLDFMQANFNQCDYAAEAVAKAKIEHSLFWTDPDTGLKLKARPDFFNHSAVFDLKTTKSINKYEFSKSIYEYGYHIQAALVMDGLKEVTGKEYDLFVIFAFEKDAPYCMAPFFISDEALAIGRARYKQILAEMKECYENPVLWLMPREIGLPNWATQKEQGELEYAY